MKHKKNYHIFGFAGYAYNTPAERFRPHGFRNEIKIGQGKPRILLTPDVQEDMYHLVNIVDKEVGWLGSVEKIGNDYLIKEIFLLDQESSAATCEITEEGMSSWANEILSSRPDGMEVVNTLRFWGHSHVRMGTSPSGQDDAQMAIFSSTCEDFFIRGILNKYGRIEFTLYLYECGVIIEDCEWGIHYPETTMHREEKWKEEIKLKVREKTFAYMNSHFNNHLNQERGELYEQQ